jgi:hypothetical protein
MSPSKQLIPLTDSVMERLAFARHLYQLGVEQSRRPEPSNAVGILMLHDAVELLLHLATEHLQVRASEKTRFMEYFDLLAPKVAGGQVSERSSMQRLNGARISFKHHGTRPSTSDVEALRGSVSLFLETNVPAIFGIDFDHVSMARLVRTEDARNALLKAESVIAQGELRGGMEHIAIAYAHIIKIHDEFARPLSARRRLSYGPSISGPMARVEHELTEIADEVLRLARSHEALQERVTFLELGIAPASIHRFHGLTPAASIAFDGTPHIGYVGPPTTPTVDDVRFCYDFVVSVALAVERRSTDGA